MRKLIFVYACLLVIFNCDDREIRKIEYMPDMYRSPAVKAMEPDSLAPTGSMRYPVKRTIPGNFVPYQFAWTDSSKADKQINPLPRTELVLWNGQKYFNIYCITCHGPIGDGKGYIVPKMTKPPELYSPKLLTWTDGRIFHTITLGQGNMPPYGTLLPPEIRWSIVQYVRVLQRAAHPTPEDLKEMKERGLNPSVDEQPPADRKVWPEK
ncbi:MAG: cytochrome c [Patescibacteria group bacterium]|nr:cytochrome c [Patescibacteria group bacterium]